MSEDNISYKEFFGFYAADVIMDSLILGGLEFEAISHGPHAHMH